MIRKMNEDINSTRSRIIRTLYTLPYSASVELLSLQDRHFKPEHTTSEFMNGIAEFLDRLSIVLKEHAERDHQLQEEIDEYRIIMWSLRKLIKLSLNAD